MYWIIIIFFSFLFSLTFYKFYHLIKKVIVKIYHYAREGDNDKMDKFTSYMDNFLGLMDNNYVNVADDDSFLKFQRFGLIYFNPNRRIPILPMYFLLATLTLFFCCIFLVYSTDLTSFSKWDEKAKYKLMFFNIFITFTILYLVRTSYNHRKIQLLNTKIANSNFRNSSKYVFFQFIYYLKRRSSKSNLGFEKINQPLNNKDLTVQTISTLFGEKGSFYYHYKSLLLRKLETTTTLGRKYEDIFDINPSYTSFDEYYNDVIFDVTKMIENHKNEILKLIHESIEKNEK